MGRDFSRNHLRSQIAHLAARLMAQDGIEDYALAKRKAARQSGAADFRQLPDNDEIDAALKLYRELYQQDHPAQLRGLRELALRVMDEFSQFDPHLSGSVLQRQCRKYAAIHLQLLPTTRRASSIICSTTESNFEATNRGSTRVICRSRHRCYLSIATASKYT
jgi:hypothetical protein